MSKFTLRLKNAKFIFNYFRRSSESPSKQLKPVFEESCPNTKLNKADQEIIAKSMFNIFIFCIVLLLINFNFRHSKTY